MNVVISVMVTAMKVIFLFSRGSQLTAKPLRLNANLVLVPGPPHYLVIPHKLLGTIMERDIKIFSLNIKFN